MKQNNAEVEKYRWDNGLPFVNVGNNGSFQFPYKDILLRVVSSDGYGWDHVSVSLPDRCPTWEEMSFIKDLFFEESEVVMQLHPAKAAHVNNIETCLHMWRPNDGKQEIPLPPTLMVGVKGVTQGACCKDSLRLN